MKQRIITACILVAVLAPLIYFGEWFSYALFIAIAGCGIYELLKVFKDKHQPLLFKIIVPLFSFILFNFSIIKNIIVTRSIPVLSTINYEPSIEIALLYLIALFMIKIIYNTSIDFKDMFLIYGFSLLITFGSFAMLYVRLKLGLFALIYLFMATMLCDVFALFSGMLFGKTKMAPRISPKKTWGGAIGGVLISSILAYVFYLIFPFFEFNGHYIVMAIITILICIVGVFGDLAFSLLKRTFEIKDYSNILPGHGGILDRFDSLMFTSLFFMSIVLLFTF